MPYFGNTSRKRLSTCDPRLQVLMNKVIKHKDCTILYGFRNETEQNHFYDTGQTQVRWPGSKHNTLPSQAVDVAPWPIPKKWGKYEVKELVKFYEFAGIVKYEAARMGLNIRWGGDWDGDGDYTDQKFDDLVHFELD